jgi:ABC-type Fe3+/spermidine/putrescine transport system ATPase subunit
MRQTEAVGLPAGDVRAGDEPSLSADRTGDAAVRLVGISKRFERTVAVDGVDLDVRPGEFVAILGPSGSGKTTTMRIIAGFIRPDTGRVEIGGRDVTDRPANRRDVNTVFQSYALFPHMTVADNIAWGLKMKRVPRAQRRERVAAVLDLVRLGDVAGQRPSQLSGGMQQRVALGRALVNEPPVLLLDEPLGALDRKLREDMQVELRQLQRRLGSAFIYVTHDQDEALGMSDRVVVMRSGRIVQAGPPATVYDNPSSLWTAEFVGASNQILGVVEEAGPPVVIRSDAARLVAGRVYGSLRAGERVVAVIRPEHIEVDPDAGTNAVERANRVSVSVDAILNVGGRVTFVARTAGGLELRAQRQREAVDRSNLRTGDTTAFTWQVEAVHVYPSGDGR